jgi:3-methyladenine DNA glycosylase AlkD
MNSDRAATLREVTRELRKLAEPSRSVEARADKASRLKFMAIRVPMMRRRVKQGFSFYPNAPGEILKTWDHIWRSSAYYEVMSCPLFFYQLQGRGIAPWTFSVISGWSDRLENWGHCDLLSSVLANLCHNEPGIVYPFLLRLSQQQNEWKRRASAVSLIHYTGPRSTYLPVVKAFAVLSKLVTDDNRYVAKAVAWVLREYARGHSDELKDFVQSQAGFASSSVRRAIGAELPSLRPLLQGR